jgi:hypothetical protein
MFGQMSLLFVIIDIAFAQSAPSTQQTAQKMIAMHDAWGERASSPNTKLAIVEESRSGDAFRFRLHAKGLPAGTIFNLVSWPVTQREPALVLRGVTFNESGIAICAGRPGTCGNAEKPDDPIDLPLRPSAGEPIRIGVISEDGTVKAFAKIVPRPYVAEDKSCRVMATLLTPRAELLYVEGTGFTAGTEIAMLTDSEGEKQEGQGKVDAAGRYVSALLPFKKGAAGGKVNIRLKAQGCSPAISVPWGS